MKKNQVVTVVFITLLFTYASTATAGRIVPRKIYNPTWRYINGLIDDRSVCNTYKWKSIDWRGCRAQAKQVFKKRCKTHTRPEWKNRAYCRAARNFKIVR